MREGWLGCPGTAVTERPVVDTAVVVIVAGNNIRVWSTGCCRACCVSGRGARKIEVKQVQKEISTNGEAIERGFLQQYAVVLCYLKSLRLRITQSSGAVLKIEVDVLGSPSLVLVRAVSVDVKQH